MEIIGDNTCFTSIRPNNKVVQCRGEQHKYWLNSGSLMKTIPRFPG
ncbi:hypothetical protein [Tatumella ptyseos]|nr:hypothetical protein [Tatumella ptyseos]